MNMPKVAIVIGVLLEMIGVAGFAHAASEHKTAVTALIPSFVGSIFIVLGVISLAQPNLRKHLMHGLAMLALIGTVAGLGRLLMTLNKEGVSPVARSSQALLGVLCLVTLMLCIKSFRDARRARQLTGEAAA